MGAPAMNIATIGIDLAKNVFQLHGVNSHGKVVLRPSKPMKADVPPSRNSSLFTQDYW
jgi:hypothetical protein